MPRQIQLDDNERAVLLALRDLDPNSEQWIATWAPGVVDKMREHGADAIACSENGVPQVFRRLAGRKLIDAEPGVRGMMRGYSLNDKGREAIN